MFDKTEIHSFSIKLTPTEGKPFYAKYINWLPDDEFDVLWNSPIVKNSSLESLLKTIFESAKTDDCKFNDKEFVNLLKSAYGQTSNDGRPLNHLSSCSKEELLDVLRKVSKDLSEEEIVSIVERFFNQNNAT